MALSLAIVVSMAASASCGSVEPGGKDLTRYTAGWGIDHHNTRYQPRSSISSANVATLNLKWTYGLASRAPRAYPLVTEDTIFVGDGGRGVVALDRATGCERWVHEHRGEISSALVPGWIDERPIIIFNDRTAGIFAIDAASGGFIWHAEVDDEPLPWYSGTPLVSEDSVYVPVSSLEVAIAMNPLYGCCTSSGGMAAFDIRNGEKRWYRPTIEAEAEVTGSHFFFVQKHGPSGAAVWGAPSYDRTLNWLFFGTGQNYSHPTTSTSDAIFAVDAASGEVMWIRQYTENDAYTAACNIVALNHPNCPKPHGPDLDFGAPTLLVRTDAGREIILAGQKSAEVHALDRRTGDPIWTTRLGRGGIIGGVHWGLAASQHLGLVFVPISDKKLMGFPAPGEAQPGLYALDISTGAQRWRYSRASRCQSQECVFGYSAAITASNDVVIAGSIDGYLEIVSATTGQLLWSHDAFREYSSVNDVPATGGAFDAHGAMIAGDMLIVSSGYAYVGEQRAGNALLVFQLETHDE